jgi:predicted aspartyl protease
VIIGTIEYGLHPRILLGIAGGKGTETLPMLVDTGFDLDVALHFDFADRLGLEIYDVALIEYANGRSEEELLCRGQVKWHDHWQEVDIVLTNDEEPAIGTHLLQGCVMTMDFIRNMLTIDKPLPRSKW